MSEKKSKPYVVLFALITSVTCSLLITAAASVLEERQQENVTLDKKINLLMAAGIVTAEKKPVPEKIKELYQKSIREILVDKEGQIIEKETPDSLHLYLYKTGNSVDGYIIPINTRGLWGKIRGYMAFDKDGQTVSGFSVYSHSETPGLGGEIESAWFRKSFQGKKIINSRDKLVSVGIARGKAENLPKDLQDHYVDGISGATLTGKYLTEGLKSTLIKYEPVSVTFRRQKGVADPKKTSP